MFPFVLFNGFSKDICLFKFFFSFCVSGLYYMAAEDFSKTLSSDMFLKMVVSSCSFISFSLNSLLYFLFDINTTVVLAIITYKVVIVNLTRLKTRAS